MTIPEPRPLDGDEWAAVRVDSHLHPCRSCRGGYPPPYVAACRFCRLPLCIVCWGERLAPAGGDFTCTGRSFQDTQKGE